MHTPVHTERRTQRAGDSNVTNQEILSDSDRGTSSTSTASTSTTTTSTIPPASVGNTEEPSATHTCTSSSDLFPFLYWIVDPAFEHRARGRLWPDSTDGARTGAATTDPPCAGLASTLTDTDAGMCSRVAVHARRPGARQSTSCTVRAALCGDSAADLDVRTTAGRTALHVYTVERWW